MRTETEINGLAAGITTHEKLLEFLRSRPWVSPPPPADLTISGLQEATEDIFIACQAARGLQVKPEPAHEARLPMLACLPRPTVLKLLRAEAIESQLMRHRVTGRYGLTLVNRLGPDHTELLLQTAEVMATEAQANELADEIVKWIDGLRNQNP